MKLQLSTVAGALVLMVLVAGASGCSLPSLAAPGAGRDRPGALEATFRVVPDSPQVGQGCEFALVIKNSGQDKVALEFSTSQEYDIVIKAGNATVWRWSDGMMFLQVISTKELAPGESLAYTVNWDGKDQDGKTLGAGTYRVEAQFKGKGATVSIPGLNLTVR
jgi:hypothetical protein